MTLCSSVHNKYNPVKRVNSTVYTHQAVVMLQFIMARMSTNYTWQISKYLSPFWNTAYGGSPVGVPMCQFCTHKHQDWLQHSVDTSFWISELKYYSLYN